MPNLIVVKATHDEEAGVWITESADLPGLRLEGGTLELLMAKLPGAIQDLLEEAGEGAPRDDIAIEVIAHASTRLHFARAG